MEFEELVILSQAQVNELKKIQLESINQTQELIVKNLFNEIQLNNFCEKLLTRWTTINTKMDTFISNNFVDEDFQDFKDSVIEAFKVFKILEKPKPRIIEFIEETTEKSIEVKNEEKNELPSFEPGLPDPGVELKKKKIYNKFYYVDTKNNVYEHKKTKTNIGTDIQYKKIGKLVNKELIYE